MFGIRNSTELPGISFLSALRKNIWFNRERIFDEKVIEYFNDQANKKTGLLHFRAGSGIKDASIYGIELLIFPDIASASNTFDNHLSTCTYPLELYTAVLLSEKENKKFNKLLQTNYLGTISQVSSLTINILEGQKIILNIYKLALTPTEEKKTKTDMHTALAAAIQSMQYESMLNTLKHIIKLRTHLPEEKIDENMALNIIFKMAFSMEQGVSIDEVYDPEAFNGLTDTQLAAKNLVSDIQKTFSIQLSTPEINSVHSLSDLARLLSVKSAG
jgi:hypothetical protein